MTHQEQAQATSRLRHALLNFKHAQTFYLSAQRKLKDQPPEQVEAFWDGPGRRLEASLQLNAKELVEAFELFSAAGLAAPTGDRHLVTEAKRSLEQDTA